jgi:hypothetical protein
MFFNFDLAGLGDETVSGSGGNGSPGTFPIQVHAMSARGLNAKG